MQVIVLKHATSLAPEAMLNKIHLTVYVYTCIYMYCKNGLRIVTQSSVSGGI